MTHIRTWPRHNQENILTKFKATEAKYECLQDFPSIWPSYLVYDQICPEFELSLELSQPHSQ